MILSTLSSGRCGTIVPRNRVPKPSAKNRPFFLYTDGLNEAEDPEKQQFGEQRMLDILRQTSYDSARQVIDALTKEVEHHRNGAEPNDDLTMFCIHVS